MKTRATIETLLASIKSALYEQQRQREKPSVPLPIRRALPFVTISRQAGAGGTTLAHLLVYQLNSIDPDGLQWSVWDRELVEKVAAEQHIPESLIDALEGHRPWLDDLREVLSFRDDPTLDEYQVYRRVAATIRGLARAGRAVIVGRGSVYATNDLPGGVHVRLVAPLEHRIKHMASQKNVSERKAAAEIRRLDAERENFHRRYWGRKALLPEMFTVTFNTALVSPKKMVECIMPLIATATHRNRAPCESECRCGRSGVADQRQEASVPNCA